MPGLTSPSAQAPVELSRVSAQGLWLRVDATTYFLSFARYPAFRDAPVSALANVEIPCPNRLYWPELDVDLAIESLPIAALSGALD